MRVRKLRFARTGNDVLLAPVRALSQQDAIVFPEEKYGDVLDNLTVFIATICNFFILMNVDQEKRQWRFFAIGASLPFFP